MVDVLSKILSTTLSGRRFSSRKIPAPPPVAAQAIVPVTPPPPVGTLPPPLPRVEEEAQPPILPLPPPVEEPSVFGELGLGIGDIRTQISRIGGRFNPEQQIQTAKGLLKIGDAFGNLVFGQTFDVLEPWQQQLVKLAGEAPILAAIPSATLLRSVLAAKLATETAVVSNALIKSARLGLLPIEFVEGLIAKVIGAPFKLAKAGLQRIPVSEVGGIKLPKPTPPTVPKGMPATQEVLNRISFEEPRAGIIEKVKEGWHKFSVGMIDDLHPIRKFVDAAQKGGEKLSFEENPYIWARLLRGVAGKTSVFLESGTFGKKFWKVVGGKAVPDFKGKGLEKILEGVRDPTVLRDFTAYLTAKRAVALAVRKIVTGIKKGDAVKATKELELAHPEFKGLADEIFTYQNQLLGYAQEMGLISKQLFNKLSKDKTYVPFYRVFEELQAKGFMGKKMANIATPVKRIKGSEREIINPLESIIKNTQLFIEAGDRNQVGVMMANLVNKNPELAVLFQPIKRPTARVARVTAKELGIDIEGLSKAEVEKVVDIFRPAMFEKENVASVLVDGKKQFFKVDPDLYKGLLNLDRESIGMLGKLLGFPARLLRAGATLSPDFMIRNPLRDQMTAFTYSNYGFLPGFDFLRGIASILGRDDLYKLYRLSGAERATLVSMDRNYLSKSFDEIVTGKGFTDYIKRPVELLQIASEFGERATRLGEFKLGIKRGATPFEAGFSSREVTLDFGKMGTTARAINHLIAFFNANIRGWDRMITAFIEKPAQTSTKVFLGITLPSILLYQANKDDPRWSEIPQWQKDLFWIVMTEDNIFRIPKPFELGILFGSVPERLMEFIDKQDPELLREVMANAAEAGAPGFIPTALLPIIENMTNFSLFRGRPIVPPSKQALPPELQYTNFTSESAKKAGELLNVSPLKIENLFNGYTGGLGRYATDILDGILKGTGIATDIPEPSPTLADRPVIKAFVVRDPLGSSSESVNRFYKVLEKLQANEQFLKQMLKQGKEDKFNEFKSKHAELLFFYDSERNDHYSATARFLRRVARDLSEIRDKQQEVFNSRVLSPKQKRSLIDQSNALLTDITRRALEALKDPSLSKKIVPTPKGVQLPTSIPRVQEIREKAGRQRERPLRPTEKINERIQQIREKAKALGR